MRALATYVTPRQDLEVEVWVGRDGRVTFAEIRNVELASKSRKRLIERFLKNQTYKGTKLEGRRFVLQITKVELDKVRPITHMCERAPRPPRKLPPHPNEIAPFPKWLKDER